jgi:hypothetical protein
MRWRWAPESRVGSLAVLLGRVAEWQTRWLQVPVRETSWGFKSPLAHHEGPAQAGSSVRFQADFYRIFYRSVGQACTNGGAITIVEALASLELWPFDL